MRNIITTVLVVVLVILTFAALTEYQEIASQTHLDPHYVNLLNPVQVSLIMNDNRSTWSESSPLNESTTVGTWQQTTISSGHNLAIEGTIQVWGFNDSAYSADEYKIVPSVGSQTGGPVLGNVTYTVALSGTFHGGWLYKVLNDGLCVPGKIVENSSITNPCDIVGIALRSPYVAYVELYAYLSPPVSPSFVSDINTSVIANLLEEQTLLIG
jgi:hypothetical protein